MSITCDGFPMARAPRRDRRQLSGHPGLGIARWTIMIFHIRVHSTIRRSKQVWVIGSCCSFVRGVPRRGNPFAPKMDLRGHVRSISLQRGIGVNPVSACRPEIIVFVSRSDPPVMFLRIRVIS